MLEGMKQLTDGYQGAGYIQPITLTKDGKALASSSRDSAKTSASQKPKDAGSEQPKEPGRFSLGGLVKSLSDRTATSGTGKKSMASPDAKPTAEKPTNEKPTTEKPATQTNLLGGLFSRKQSAEPAPNPERDAFFAKQFKAAENAIHEKYGQEIAKSGEQIRYARYSGIDLEGKATSEKAMTEELKELAQATARPPIVIDVENKPLIQVALGDLGSHIKSIAIGGPKNKYMYVELNGAKTTDLAPFGSTPKNQRMEKKYHIRKPIK